MTIPDSESTGVCEVPYSPEEERRIVTELNNEAEADLKEGNLYFVISNRSLYIAIPCPMLYILRPDLVVFQRLVLLSQVVYKVAEICWSTNRRDFRSYQAWSN